MSGPPVQQITRTDSLANIKNKHHLFFMYVGPQEGHLWEAYLAAAAKLQPYGFFYSAKHDLVKQHADIDDLPAVFVYKENLQYFYPGKYFIYLFIKPV